MVTFFSFLPVFRIAPSFPTNRDDMSHFSPTVYLVWTILTGLLNAFLLFHLWSFDRFQCLRWNSKAHAGAFKRFMTYSYLLTVPMIFTFALGSTIVKYREGWISLPFFGIIPKPYLLWSSSSRATIFPLTLLFSFAWSLELVTHLEELCFWLYLVNAGTMQQYWFRTPYFQTWIGGSILAIIYMPIVTIITRADPLQCEAFTFLAGSLGSLSLTLWFIPILYAFPAFLRNLRSEGVEISTVIRLTKFSELNTIRVVMRLLFTVPLVILSVDGVRPEHHVNENMFATDFLATIAGFGVVISSAITLVIFFPRSIEGEIAARDELKERRRSRRQASTIASFRPGNVQNPSPFANARPDDHELRDIIPGDDRKLDLPLHTKINVADHGAKMALRKSRLNPMIANYRSPIDLVYDTAEETVF